jgi:hypothetical protein
MLYSVNLLERSHLPITLVHAQKRNVDNFDRIPVCCPSAFIYLEPIVSVNKGIYFRSKLLTLFCIMTYRGTQWTASAIWWTIYWSCTMIMLVQGNFPHGGDVWVVVPIETTEAQSPLYAPLWRGWIIFSCFVFLQCVYEASFIRIIKRALLVSFHYFIMSWKGKAIWIRQYQFPR